MSTKYTGTWKYTPVLVYYMIFSTNPGDKVSYLALCDLLYNSNLAYTRHSPNAVSMLANHFQSWPNIETALGKCLMFVESKLQIKLNVLPLKALSAAIDLLIC